MTERALFGSWRGGPGPGAFLLLAGMALGVALSAGLRGCEKPAEATETDGGDVWNSARDYTQSTSGAVGGAATSLAPTTFAPTPRTTAPAMLARAEALTDLRVRKCRRIVEQLYPASGFGPYVEFFIEEHERLGMGEAWWWSAVYGGANFSLQVGGKAPGGCAGPMDVKHWPRVTDPEANIRWHCREMLGFWKRGVRGRDLCESVFYPAAPRDWGGGRFRRTDRKHRECIERGYQFGKL